VREVAGEPEQLELEAERERVESSAPPQTSRNGVENGQKAGERLERALVPLLLDEEPKHCLGADEADREAVGILPSRTVWVDERGARDRMQLARSLVEKELHVRERLEARTEARLRLPDSLGDRPDSSSVERVHVEDAIRLPEPERPKDDRLGLVAAGHAAKSRPDAR